MKRAVLAAAVSASALCAAVAVAEASTTSPAARVQFQESCTKAGYAFAVRGTNFPATPTNHRHDAAYQNWYKVTVDDGGTEVGGAGTFGRQFFLFRGVDTTKYHHVTVRVHNWRTGKTTATTHPVTTCGADLPTPTPTTNP